MSYWKFYSQDGCDDAANTIHQCSLAKDFEWEKRGNLCLWLFALPLQFHSSHSISVSLSIRWWLLFRKERKISLHESQNKTSFFLECNNNNSEARKGRHDWSSQPTVSLWLQAIFLTVILSEMHSQRKIHSLNSFSVSWQVSIKRAYKKRRRKRVWILVFRSDFSDSLHFYDLLASRGSVLSSWKQRSDASQNSLSDTWRQTWIEGIRWIEKIPTRNDKRQKLKGEKH